MQKNQVYSFKRFLPLCLFSLICSSLLFTQSALAADIAGRIIMARGDVQAINDEGVIRQLKRRDSIYNHEVIKTGKESKVQIRFIDNALLALKAESELNIKAYVYSATDEEDNQVLMELVAGGFRTLTGKIGKGNKEAYKVDTPVASIGIRGTLYDVQISFDKILAGVWKGGISLDTAQGKFDLGLNSNFDFGEISSAGVFKGLLTPPQAFTPPTPRTKGTPAAENDSGNNPAQKFSSDDKTTTATGEAALTEERTTTDGIPNPHEKEKQPTASKIAKKITEQNGRLLLSEALQDNPGAIQKLADELDVKITDLIKPADVLDPVTDPVIDPTDPNDPTTQVPNTSPDLRLSNAEMDQLIADNTLAILLGSNNQNIAIALNTEGTGEVFFLAPDVAADGTSTYETIRRGDATEADFSNIQPWSDKVSWGIWQGTSENPIQRFTEFNNNQDFTPLAQDLFYMLAQPATSAELNAGLIEGTMNFSTSSVDLSTAGQTDFIASSNVGEVIDVNAQFDLTASAGNYSISNIYLNVDIDTNSELQGAEQSWSMQAATGQINGSSISVDNLTGSFITIQAELPATAASGTLNGLLLAPSPNSSEIDTFTGSFELSTDDGANNTGGIIILQTGQSLQLDRVSIQ